jgi:hypothetical protein
MDGLNACPPEAHNCYACRHFERTAPPAVPDDVKGTIRATLAKAPHGLTSEELARLAGLNENTVRGRLSEMERAGLVRRKRERHRTWSGRKARVYVLALAPQLAASGAVEGQP